MPKILSSSCAILAVAAVAFVTGCSNSDEANNADDKPNFTGSSVNSAANEEAIASGADGADADGEGSKEEPATETVTEKAEGKQVLGRIRSSRSRICIRCGYQRCVIMAPARWWMGLCPSI